MGFVVTSVGWSLAPFPRWWSLLGLWVSRAPVDAHSWHDLLLSLRELTGRRLCSALWQRSGLHGGQTQRAGRCSSCGEMAQSRETTAKTWLPRLPRALAPVRIGVLLFRFKYYTLKDTFAFSHSFQMKFFYISQLAYWLHALPELYFQKTKKVSGCGLTLGIVLSFLTRNTRPGPQPCFCRSPPLHSKAKIPKYFF